jgi:hypothetical protein
MIGGDRNVPLQRIHVPRRRSRPSWPSLFR